MHSVLPTLEILRVLLAVMVIFGLPLLGKRRWRLFAAIVFSVFQVYLPGEIFGMPLPLALFAGLLLWPEFLREVGSLGAWKPTAILLAILATYFLSLFWSVDLRLGLTFIVHLISFLLIFSAVVVEGRNDPKFVWRLISWSLWLACGQAVAIGVFQCFPEPKLVFLHSSVGTWFISSKVLADLFTVSKNNVLDPVKSGGILFVNANIAAAYSGVMSFTAIGVGMTTHRRRFYFLGAILFLSIFFTGSKAGVLFAILLSGMTLLIVAWRHPRWRHRLLWGIPVILVVGTIFSLGYLVSGVLDLNQLSGKIAFLGNSLETLQSRKMIWGYALEVFPQNMIIGEGFGGWQKGFEYYAARAGLWSARLPPHNTLIYLWSQAGLVAALLGIGFMYRIVRMSCTQLRAGQHFGLALATSMAFLWTFFHGMGTNFGLLGEVHMAPILAALLGLSYVHLKVAPPLVGEPVE